jgi:hypothetical protein
MSLEFDPAFKQWNSCRPEDLFTAPIKKEVRKYLIIVDCCISIYY